MATVKTKVLLVDDEKSFTSLLRLNLEDTGKYEVQVENWPEDAINKAKVFKPDIILLDLIMPRLPGGNVVSLLDQDPELKHIPVVFLTAAVRRHQIDENEGIICDRPCIAKPSSVEEIVAAIDRYALH